MASVTGCNFEGAWVALLLQVPQSGREVLEYSNDIDEAKEWDLGAPDYSISGKIFSRISSLVW